MFRLLFETGRRHVKEYYSNNRLINQLIKYNTNYNMISDIPAHFILLMYKTKGIN